MRVLEAELIGSSCVRDGAESCVGTRVVYEPKSNLFWLFYRLAGTEITGFGLAPCLIGDERRTVLSKRVLQAARARMDEEETVL